MDRGKQETQRFDEQNVGGPTEVHAIQESQQNEQLNLIRIFISTIHHYFGAFSPSIPKS